jgi:hypothetical protein
MRHHHRPSARAVDLSTIVDDHQRVLADAAPDGIHQPGVIAASPGDETFYSVPKNPRNRFRSKRKQGEWFEPNTLDVEAFKARREFMFSEFFP